MVGVDLIGKRWNGNMSTTGHALLLCISFACIISVSVKAKREVVAHGRKDGLMAFVTYTAVWVCEIIVFAMLYMVIDSV